MRLRRIEIFEFALVLATFVAAVLVYPRMPVLIASHWGINNQVNGYTGKFWGVFLLPLIMFGCYLLLIIIPRVDPKAHNIKKFEKHFDLFVTTFLLFFAYIFGLTIFWNLGLRFNLVQFMVPGFAFLFYAISTVVRHAEPNWTIGIRTPWTLSSDSVWHKTHKLGGKLFQVVAVISLLGIFMPSYAIWFVTLPVMAVAINLVLYSYLEYRKI